MARPYSPTSTYDVYGNARPVYRARREVGNFQNQVQRAALQGIQDFGRRVDRRDGLVPFALTSDVFARRRTASIGLYQNPFLMGRLPAWRQTDTGFDAALRRRADLREGADPQMLIARRYALLAARSLNAPVHRASALGLTPTGSGLDMDRTPFLAHRDAVVATSSQSLEDRLRATTESAWRRMRAEAWTSFREGNFRRAARAFQTAAELRPEDGESRIGHVFCQLALGASRTAGVAFAQWIQHEQNPFRYSLNMAEAFGSSAALQRLRGSVLVGSAGEDVSPTNRALRVVILWYLGEHDEAAQRARRLARDEPGTIFADWPIKMSAARTGSADGEGQRQ